MPRPVSVRSGQVEFLKLNLEKREWRDTYQRLLALTWPEFAAFIAGVYIVINLVFAEFYALGGKSIAGMTPGSYFEAFFFSVQTLATVGAAQWRIGFWNFPLGQKAWPWCPSLAVDDDERLTRYC